MLKRKLNKNLTIFKTNNFPFRRTLPSSKKYLATIGIGGNIGNTKRIFDKLFLHLKGNKHFEIMQSSILLLNPPFGYLNQKDFLNGVIVLKTNLYINDFFKIMQRYEKRFKRVRSFKDAPRTLDIDIIFFDNKKINTKKLIIPHKHWNKRDSVVIPLKSLKGNK